MSQLLFDWRNCSRMRLVFLIMFYLDVSQGTAIVFFHLCLWLSVLGGGVSGDSSFF